MQRALYVGMFAVVLAAQFLFAQTAGTISGEIRDQSGAVLPAAAVKVKNVETGITRDSVADEQGRYRATNLPVGKYEIRAEHAGFQAAVRSGIELTIGREAIVNLILPVGEVTQAVSVIGEAPLIDTTSSSVSGLVSEKVIADLPLNGRSYDQLITLNTGTVQYEGRGRGIGSMGNGNLFAVSGVRIRSNRFTMDGLEAGTSVSLSTTPGGVSGNNLGVEAIREFTVMTSTYPAEFGKKAGGQVNVVTKSGTNEVHGSVFYLHRNDNLDARNFFDPVKPEFRRNQFGGALGGPIRRNKTFYFGNYEGLREGLGLTGIAIVPDANARRGIFPGSPTVIPVNPVVVPYLDLYPLPSPGGRNFNDGTGEFIGSSTNVTRQDYILGRVDHQLSDNSSVFGRYLIDDGDLNNRSLLGVTVDATRIRNQHVTVSEQQIFSPALLNVVRLGFNRSGADQQAQILKGGLALGFIPGKEMGSIGFGGVGASQTLLAGIGSATEQFFVGNTYEASNQVSYSRGSHSTKFGVEIQRIQRNEDGAFSQRGEYNFGSIQDFLQGRPNTFRGPPPGTNPIKGWRQTYFSAHAQDDYRVTSRLTANLGLRYEIITVPKEAHNQISNFVTELVNGYRIFRTDPKVGNPIYEQNGKFSFGPRVGFALDLTGTGKMSLRGGAGLYYDQIEGEFRAFLSGLPPFFSRFSLTNPPFPHALQAPQLTPEPSGIDDHLAVPTVAHYNLNYQWQFLGDMVLRVGYGGSRGYHLTRSGDINIAIPQIAANGQKFFPATGTVPRRNPNLASGRLIQTDSVSRYNSLQTEITKPFTRGLQFRIAYTYSRSLDTAPGVFNQEAQRESQNRLDPEDINRDKGPSSFNTPHNLSISYIYDLPGTNAFSGPVRYLLAGWQLNGIAAVSAGTPFSALTGFNRSRNGDTRNPDRPDLAPGRNRDNILSGASTGCTGTAAGTKLRAPDFYFDRCAYDLPAPGTWGNLGRNTLTGPGRATWDFSLTKNTALPAVSEQFRIQFRAEFFNVFNRANFFLPASNIFTSSEARVGSAGRITNTVTTARQIQMGLKILF